MMQLTKEKIIEYLSVSDENRLQELYGEARKIRAANFGNKIFIYGFVYFSTYCQNDCNFCNFRKSHSLDRYRKTKEEIMDIGRSLIKSGVHLLDLTMGEDRYFYAEGFESIIDVIKELKKESDVKIMISPGLIDNKTIDRFAAVGTDFYALYQETHNKRLFEKLRIKQDYDKRIDAKIYAASKGIFIEDGILVGVGETLPDIADSLLKMKELNARQVRVMSFIPHDGTPMEGVKTPDRNLELKVIAVMRLLLPNALIPASLDVDGINGLAVRMNAGANVITSIIPPKAGLSGVAQTGEELARTGRTVEETVAILKEMGLEPASQADFNSRLR